MTHDRHAQHRGSGSRQPSISDQYQNLHADCPSFDGSDTVAWFRRCQSFFKMHHVPEDYIELHQSGSTEDYIERFEHLRSKLLVENQFFSEADFLDAFVGELKLELRAFVKVFKPQILEDVFEYALQMDTTLDSQFKKLRFSPRVPAAPFINKLVPSPINSKNVLLDQKRLLGLCFKCDEKYFFNHPCRVKVQILLDQENLEETSLDLVLDLAIALEPIIEEAIIYLHASQSNLHQITMRLKDQI
jgi:hypothetical protein